MLLPKILEITGAAEQERQHKIREAGGLLAGDELVSRHPTDDTEVMESTVFGNNVKCFGGEHSFQPESTMWLSGLKYGLFTTRK